MAMLFDTEMNPLDSEPIEPRAEQLADAMFDLIHAKSSLDKAKREVPSYTGQNSPDLYYSKEQNDYNKAAKAYADAVAALFQSTQP